MASAVPPPGAPHVSDITGRMAVFGRLFSEDVGLPDPTTLADADSLLGVVRARVPRTTQAADESPVFEAAAFVGEWMRGRSNARWVAEGPYEPHLQVIDPGGSIVYLLPLVSVMRVATTAGYDGLANVLESVLADTSTTATRLPLDDVRVLPPSDGPRVAAWVRANAALESGASATLWRRCQTCAQLHAEALELSDVEATWETQAADAASVLSSRVFSCSCGGAPGEVSRFLMLRARGGDRKLADIHVAGTFTRVACWTILGDVVEPYDATALAVEDVAG